jgi:hypothetical protein
LALSVFGVNKIDDKIRKIECFIKSSELCNYPIALLNEAVKFIKKRKRENIYH